MRQKMKRREFMGKATLGVMAAGISGSLPTKAEAGQEQAQKIVFRKLGRTGLQIPIVSFGVMNSDSPDLIQRSLDLGINHLDTAHVYLRGNSERVIGEVLERNGNRDSIYLATKMAFNRDQDERIFLEKGVDARILEISSSLFFSSNAFRFRFWNSSSEFVTIPATSS